MFRLRKTFFITLLIILSFAITSCNKTLPANAENTSTTTDTLQPTTVSTEATAEPTLTADPTQTAESTMTAEGSPTQEPGETMYITPSPAIESPIFGPQNPETMGLFLEMRYDDAEILAGKYTDITTYDERESISSYSHICSYFFGSVGYVQDEQTEFSNSWIYFISVEMPGYSGPMDIQVGDSFETAISKLGIPENYFVQEYSDIYIDDEIVGSVYFSDASTESCQIILHFTDDDLKIFFVNTEDGEVINYGVAEQLN